MNDKYARNARDTRLSTLGDPPCKQGPDRETLKGFSVSGSRGKVSPRGARRSGCILCSKSHLTQSNEQINGTLFYAAICVRNLYFGIKWFSAVIIKDIESSLKYDNRRIIY